MTLSMNDRKGKHLQNSTSEQLSQLNDVERDSNDELAVHGRRFTAMSTEELIADASQYRKEQSKQEHKALVASLVGRLEAAVQIIEIYQK